MLYRSTSSDLAFRTLSNDELRNNARNTINPKDAINAPVIVSVGMALFCDFLLLTLCIPILPELFKDSQFSGFATGLVFASKPFFQFFANPVMGNYVERHGPKAPLLTGVLILSISTIVFAFGTSLKDNIEASFAIVLVARSTQGIASASIMSAGMTLCAMTHSEQIRGSAMGLAFTGVALGTLLGPPIGGILGYYVNLWFPFVLVAGILFIVYASMKFLFRSVSVSDPMLENNLKTSLLSASADRSGEVTNMTSIVQGVVHLLKDPIISYVGFLAVLGNMTIGLIEPLVPRWLDDEFDQNILWQGIIFGSASLSYLISTPLAGFVSDKYPKRVCLCIGFLSCALGLCTFSAADSIPQACMSLALVGAGIGFVDTPILPLLALIVELPSKPSPVQQELNSMNNLPVSDAPTAAPADLGYVYALNDMFLCIGFTVGPILGSGLASAFQGGSSGFKNATLVFGLFVAIVAPSPLLALRRIELRTVSGGDHVRVSSSGQSEGGDF